MLLNARDLTVGFGAEPVLDKVSFTIEAGERIALLGRNGAGKSTLLKVLCGELQPEDGQLILRDGAHVARLGQTMPDGQGERIHDVVAAGLGEAGTLLQQYGHATEAVAESPSDANLQEMQRVQQALESSEGWQLHQRVETTLSRLNLDGAALYESLSGGMRRRVLLAQALVQQPELLLLDEPTNHLDIAGITQLEDIILDYPGALLLITHDRAFLRRVASRILLLDRGRLTSYPGDYERFLRTRAQELEAEDRQHAEFDRKLAQEERWIRQGIKARRTRNEGRVRALEAMRRERAQRRTVQGKADFALQDGGRSGKLVLEASNISKAFGGRAVVQGFSTTILRGDKIGLIGPNGSGKSTLLNMLLGRLQPDEGTVRLGTQLDVAYFDQLRETLNDSHSVAENVSGGAETVTINGEQRHIYSYLQDFLFTPAQARGPISALSGGERNRLVLARLFTRPANLLVLDEPTNDLDLETLELLEALLVDFPGTVLLVSHDREFLDNVVTSSLVFKGDGRIIETVGGYRDYERQHGVTAGKSKPADDRAMHNLVTDKPDSPSKPEAQPRRRAKLNYREQRELQHLPGKIETLEQEQASLAEQLADPAFFRNAADVVAETTARLSEIEAELEQALERWTDLEDRA